MGKIARKFSLVFIPAAAAALAFVSVQPVSAEDAARNRYVCPLRQAFTPGVDTAVFNPSGPFAGDFRLRDVYGEGLTSLLDAARSDYTFLYFLDRSSNEALHGLKVLQALRDSSGGRIGLTAVFLDPGERGAIRRYLDDHDIVPDFALHDPRRTQARCYGFDSPPVLHVIGPRGRIMLTASGSNPVDLAAFTTDLGKLLNRECAYSRFAEARGIYLDAANWLKVQSPDMAVMYLERILEIQPQLYTVNRTLADVYHRLHEPQLAARHYGRYLAAGYAYDTEEIRKNLKELAAR